MLGIIGGSGPFASLDIEKNIIELARERLLPNSDNNYPSMLIYQYTQFSYNDKCSKQFLHCAKILENARVKFIIIACNSAHSYFDFLQKNIKVEILNIIKTTAQYFSQSYKQIQKVGLLANDMTINNELYVKEFKRINVQILTPSIKARKQISQGIYYLKLKIYDVNKQNIHTKPLKFFAPAIQELIEAGSEHIILGCTEMPLILGSLQRSYKNITIINPNKIIAKKALEKYYEKNIK